MPITNLAVLRFNIHIYSDKLFSLINILDIFLFLIQMYEKCWCTLSHIFKIRDIHMKTGFTPRSSIENYIKTKFTIRNVTYHSGILQNSVMNLEKTF